jgi:sulfur dioxygenase
MGMIFRQLLDTVSSSYTYILAAGPGSEAFIIDPVKARLPQYLQLLAELDVQLTVAIDTHIHADHLTALGDLREATGCATVMGAQSPARCVTKRVVDGEMLSLNGIELRAMHTPGHTSESYSFFLKGVTAKLSSRGTYD